jgi:hypothetical protein
VDPVPDPLLSENVVGSGFEPEHLDLYQKILTTGPIGGLLSSI